MTWDNIPWLALMLAALLVSFVVSAAAALEFWRDNNELRRRLEEIEDRRESSRASGAR